MDDSLKGMLVMLTLAGLFVTSIFSFITLFPQEQGAVFSSGEDNVSYLTVQQNIDPGTLSELETIRNTTTKGFNEWDVGVGFMGSNTVKQSSGSGITSYATNIFDTLTIIATQIFGQNSPIIYVISVLAVLMGSYIIYLVIKFVRTGN